jgi:hypothetical protein
MNRMASVGLLVLTSTVLGFLMSCGSSSSLSTSSTVAITAASGTPQGATVGSAFAAPLVAMLTSNGSPLAGVTVTFTAPVSGASGVFMTSGTAMETDTTNESGVATSSVFTANTVAGAYLVSATATGATIAASFSLTNNAAAATTVTATGGTPQSATVGTAFATNLAATVLDSNSSPVSGVSVTFTAPASGPSGAFMTSGGASETDVTDASGMATSSAFTANATTGPYTVTASAIGAAATASFSLTNVAGAAATITATGGTPQNAPVHVAFVAPLTVSVTDSDSNPVTGATVTFTVRPVSGASGTFANSTATDTETTDEFGTATSSTLTANATTGTYAVTASLGVLPPVTFSLTNILPPLADGNYVFSLGGQDAFGNYYVSGVFTLEGGAVVGGEQDSIDQITYGIADGINPAGSSVSTTPDGNLLITLNTTDGDVGTNGVETFNGSVLPLNPNKAFITEIDEARASGELDLQTSTSIPPSPVGYAFAVNGVDINEDGLALGGVITVDSLGNISGANSIFDANDGGSGSNFQGETFAASTVSGPDSFGRVLFTLNPTDSADFPQIILAGYVVDGNHVQLVESADSFVGTLGGTALGQTGTFNSASISGQSYVVSLNGFEVISALQAAGLITFNADGTLSGFINYNDLTGTGPQAPSAVTGGTYTVASTGDVTLTGVTDGKVSFSLHLYLDGNGHSLTVSTDTNDVLSGIGFQQSSGPFPSGSFNGAYALGITGTNLNETEEFYAVGPASANGNTGTISGTVDLGLLFASGTVVHAPVPLAAAGLSGNFSSTSNGVFTGTISGVDLTTCPLFDSAGSGCTSDTFTYFLINTAGANILIETDTNQLTLGYFAQQ